MKIFYKKNLSVLLFLLSGLLPVFILPVAHGQKGIEPRLSTPEVAPRPLNERSTNTLLFEDFQDVDPPALPQGWTSNSIEGDFVTGDAEDANEGGYFPVPDRPGNIFAMANDDVCNCDMSDIELVLPELDFTGGTDMVIRFDAYHDKNFGGGDATVQVSKDQGTSWDTVRTLNAVQGKWQSYVVDLSAYDGQSSVTLKFHWNDGGTWSTGLAVDNVVVDEWLDHDMRLKKTFTTDMVPAFEYSVLPLEQTPSLTVGGLIRNVGKEDQTGIELDVELFRGNTSIHTDTGSSFSLQSLKQDSSFVNTGFSLDSAGEYTVQYAVSSDSTEEYPDDNSDSASFEVGCKEYARDEGNYTGKGIWNGQDSTGTRPYRVGSLFEIPNAGSHVKKLRVVLDDSSQAGGAIRGRIYRRENGFIPVDSTEWDTVEAGAISSPSSTNWVDLSFSDELSLQKGEVYMAALEYDGGQNRLFTATSGLNPNNTAFLYDIRDSSWTSVTSTPMVRMVFSQNLGSLLRADTALCFPDTLELEAAPGFQTYKWNTGESTRTIDVDSSGTYAVTVTKANGCTSRDTVEVSNELDLDLSVAHVECPGDSTGMAAVSVQGGQEPYDPIWSDGTKDDTLSGIPAGTYGITVTDDNGCENIDSVTVEEPLQLDPNASSEDLSCKGAGDGRAWVDVEGGTPGYDVSWSTGAVADTISGLDTGTYTVTVTDTNGCKTTDTIKVDAPEVLTIQFETRGVTCKGDADGWAFADITGGTPPYDRTWSNGQSSDTAVGLSSGKYGITVTDSNGCSHSDSVMIPEPAPLVLDTGRDNPDSCKSNDGQAWVNPSGGWGNFDVDWSTGATSDTISGLSAGSYEVVVVDSLGCTKNPVISLSDPAAPEISIKNKTENSCPGDSSGSVDLHIAGGNPPFVFNWFPDVSDDSTANNLPKGGYIVDVLDTTNGCKSSFSFDIEGPEEFAVGSSIQHVTCAGDSNGMIMLTVNGGTAPYSYQWSNGVQDDTVQGLSGGDHSVTIEDSLGCTLTRTYTLNEPDSLELEISKRDLDCYGDEDGIISVDASGGVPPYEYDWSNGAKKDSLTNMPGGIYSVVVTDSNGCTRIANGEIVEPDSLTIEGTVNDTGSYGFIDVTVNGGVPPYSYKWDPTGQDSEDLDSLTDQGVYEVAVKDDNGCTGVDSFVVGGSVSTGPAYGSRTSWGLNAYPNPSPDGTLTLEWEGHPDDPPRIEILDMLGASIRSLSSIGDGEQLRITGLDPGVYFLRVSMNGKVLVKRIVVQ